LLVDPAVQAVVVEHRDSPGMITELVESALAEGGRKLGVAEDAGPDDGLVRDVTEVPAAFYARRYGEPSARNRAVRAVHAAQEGA
jgi:putative resolvase